MKFKTSKSNVRIYCLEDKSFGKKKVTMAHRLFNKTSENNNKTNQSIIDAIAKYKYDYKKQQ